MLRLSKQPAILSYPGDFAITPFLREIFDTFNTHGDLILKCPTSTGKTLLLPRFFNTCYKAKIRISIPTIVACRNAYHYQKENTPLDVGYAAGRVKAYKDSTKVVYATPGHYVNRIKKIIKENKSSESGSSAGEAGSMEDIRSQVKELLGDIFFFDEVHMLNVQMSLLMGLIAYIFPPGVPRPRFFFASATLNSSEIESYFGKIHLHEITIAKFPMEIIYKTCDVFKKVSVLETIQEILKETQGTTLIFRPGIDEVNSLWEKLEEIFPDYDFFAIHSRLLPEEIDKIFLETEKRKIVISTNMCESSVTIPNVEVVIDDCLVKNAETSAMGGKRLALTYTTQSEGIQRTGRGGRMCPGKSFRLISEMEFLGLPKFRKREVEEIPIENEILTLLDCGLDPSEILHTDKRKVEMSISFLNSLGLIDENGEVTDAGRYVSRLGLSPQNGLMIYLARNLPASKNKTEKNDFHQAVVVVAAMIELFDGGFFWVPHRERNEKAHDYQERIDAYHEQYHEVFRGRTDIHTLFNLYCGISRQIKFSKNKHVKKNILDYSKFYSLNNQKLQELMVIIRDLFRGMDFENEPGLCELEEAMADDIVDIFREAYARNTLTYIPEMKKYLSDNGVKYVIDKKNSFCEVGREPILIAGGLIEISSRGSAFNVATLIVDE